MLSRYLDFCLDFLFMWKNVLIIKIRLISKFMTSQPGKQTNAIHILSYNSRSKDNQNITRETFFLKNHTQNVVEKLVPDHFLKNQNWAYLWINSLKFWVVYFYCVPNWGLSKYIEIKFQTTCFYLLQSFFKNKIHFVQTFLRKIFLLLYSIDWPNFIICLFLLREILGNICIAIVC